MRLEKIHRSTKPFPDDLNQLRAGLNWQYLQFKNNSDDGKIFKTGLVIDLVMPLQCLEQRIISVFVNIPSIRGELLYHSGFAECARLGR